MKTVDAYLKIIYAAVKTILSGSTFLDFSIHDQNIPDENDLHPRCKSISVAQLSKNACSMFVEVYESRFHSEDIAVNVGGSILETFHSMQSEGNFDIYHTPSVGDKVLAMYRNKYNGIFTLHNTAMTKVMEALGIDCIAKHYETINGAIMFFNTKVEVSRNDGQEITNRFMSINCSTEQYNFANILSDDSFALIELTPSEVKCLSPVDHKATVEAWSQTAVIQDILIPHFRQHWRTKLYPGHNRGDESVEINTSREIFEKVSLLWNFLSSLLHSEYDGDSWRSGLTGSGIALEDQCKIRISAINNISKTLPGFDWFVAPENIFGTDSVCARSTLKKCLQQLCSCSYDEFFNLLALLDHIVKQFSTVSAVASDNAVMADDFCKSHSKAKLSLISQAKELISIASLCCMERIITTIFFSLRGLLWALQLKKNNDPDRDSEELMALVIR